VIHIWPRGRTLRKAATAGRAEVLILAAAAPSAGIN
jgi:hypothetical protein